jgi:hypothetical protein
MRARHVVGALISAATVAGCSNTQATEPAANQSAIAQLESAAAAQAALPGCAEVFVPGKPVDEQLARAGCKSKRGVVQFVGFFECADGGILFQVDATTGAPNGYGFGGKPYRVVKGESAADKGYKKAYEACQSGKTEAAGSAPKRQEKSMTKPTVETVAGEAAAAEPQAVMTEATAETADEPTPEPTRDLVPVPGGEWRSRPSPTPTSTEDPA